MAVPFSETLAKCERCGYQLVKPFQSFEVADDSRCPQCGHDLAGIEPLCSDQIDLCHILQPGLRLDQCPRDFVAGVVDKAFKQGLDSIDLKITFLDRYDDEARIEVLAIR